MTSERRRKEYGRDFTAVILEVDVRVTARTSDEVIEDGSRVEEPAKSG